MKATITERDLRNITLTHEYSELGGATVEPERVISDPEFGDIVEHPPISEAYGFSELRGRVQGFELTIFVDWATSGETDGCMADLYDWDRPSVNEQALDIPIRISSTVVLNEDGDELDEFEVADILSEILDEQDCWQLGAAGVLPLYPGDETIDEDSDMDTITVLRDNKPNIRFSGEELAEATSYHAHNNDTRWTELALYYTKGGKYICERVDLTRWQGERDRYSAAICDTMDEVQQFFGYGPPARELYDKVWTDAAEHVE